MWRANMEGMLKMYMFMSFLGHEPILFINLHAHYMADFIRHGRGILLMDLKKFDVKQQDFAKYVPKDKIEETMGEYAAPKYMVDMIDRKLRTLDTLKTMCVVFIHTEHLLFRVCEFEIQP
jgi:uncharacterized membrane protein YheB (UPF0754 family)